MLSRADIPENCLLGKHQGCSPEGCLRSCRMPTHASMPNWYGGKFEASLQIQARTSADSTVLWPCDSEALVGRCPLVEDRCWASFPANRRLVVAESSQSPAREMAVSMNSFLGVLAINALLVGSIPDVSRAKHACEHQTGGTRRPYGEHVQERREQVP